MQVSTQVEPRLLDERKVKKFLSQALYRIEAETREETAREILGKASLAECFYDENGNGRANYYHMDVSTMRELKAKYTGEEK